MVVSFLILNYNSAELTSIYAKTVAEYKLVDHVIVVDNCSTDNSYDILSKLDTTNIHVVQSERNGVTPMVIIGEQDTLKDLIRICYLFQMRMYMYLKKT